VRLSAGADRGHVPDGRQVEQVPVALGDDAHGRRRYPRVGRQMRREPRRWPTGGMAASATRYAASGPGGRLGQISVIWGPKVGGSNPLSPTTRTNRPIRKRSSCSSFLRMTQCETLIMFRVPTGVDARVQFA
jgi:hypothetical protein